MNEESLREALIDRDITISYYRDLVLCYEAYLDTIGKPDSKIQHLLRGHIGKLKSALGYKTDETAQFNTSDGPSREGVA